nr:MAG TPA: hypothetical protein [Caudoviricetes sp.]
MRSMNTPPFCQAKSTLLSQSAFCFILRQAYEHP